VFTDPGPSVVIVRYSKTTSITMTAIGGAMIVGWIALLILRSNSEWPLVGLGLILSYAGINSFYRPFCVYDTASGSIVFPAIFGTGRQVIGGQAREHLQYNGKRLERLGLNGRIRPVSRWTANREDFNRLIAAVATPASEDRWKQRERRK
jgi:hypothetical protein